MAITRNVRWSASQTSSNSVTSGTATPAANDLIVVFANITGGQAPTLTHSGGLHANAKLVPGAPFGPGGGSRNPLQWAWYVPGAFVTATAGTWNITTPSSCLMTLGATSYSGLAQNTPLDKVSAVSVAVGTAIASGAIANTTNPNSLIVGHGTADSTGAVTWTAGTTPLAFTNDGSAGITNAVACPMFVEAAVVAATGNYPATGTSSSGTVPIIMVTYAFSDTDINPPPPATGVSAVYRRRHHRVVQNAASGGGGGGGTFVPQANFSGSGTVAADGVFVVNSALSIFGSTGPTLIMQDDFRAQTAGTQLQNNTSGIAGSGQWQQNGTLAGTPFYERLGRSGLYPALALNDNEVPGSGNSFGRKTHINLGAEYQQIFYAYAETSRNTWGFRNFAPGNGGYFKFNWLDDGGNFGATAYDCFFPTFIAGSSPNQAISTITWSGGIASVTCSAGMPFPLAPGYTQFPLNLNNSVNTAYNCPYANGVMATPIDSTHFTYPIASNPGAYTGGATYDQPGSGSTNMPCGNIPLVFGGNSWAANGLPSYWFAVGDTNGLTKWDQVGWNSHEFALFGNVANPTTAAGILYTACYNSPNKQAYSVTDSTRVLFSATAGYSSFRALYSCGLLQTTGSFPLILDRCDPYCAVGPNCFARFGLGDASTLANCTTMQYCTPGAWAAGSVSLTLRQGAFSPSLAGAYLYFWDASNNPTLLGHF